MKRIVLAIGVVLGAAGLAWAQNPPNNGGQQGDGGLRTPDMDPAKKGKLDPAKEFPEINKQADAAMKDVKSFTAKAKVHETGASASLDARTEAVLKARRVKSADLWLFWDDPGVPDRKIPAVQMLVIGKKVTTVWPEAKEYERVDAGRQRDVYPPQILFGFQYQPSKFSEEFEMKLTQPALKYKAANNAGYDSKKDPFADKAKNFGKEKAPANDAAAPKTPDPETHHTIVLVPKDKKLLAVLSSITLYVHMKTFVIDQADIKFAGDRSMTIELSDVKLGADVADKDVQLDISALKERVKK